MHKLLIPLVAVLLGTATLLHAQVPVSASIAQPSNSGHVKQNDAPENACTNMAGTFVLGAAGVNTQSNDLTLDTLFLCFGDSIFINHNPDAILTGDPDPSTTPGVGWAFYDCTPSVTGDNLQMVALDPCVLLSPTSGLPVLAVGNPQGDVWFFNSGFLQTTYNSGQPVLLHFAPITIDSFGIPPTYESAQVGAPPGPCVNVNTGVQFSVVYLNAITAAGITTNFGNDCLGKFRIKGGYPEWDPTALYTISISLNSDPTVKALIHTSPSQFFHGADIVFSVSQPGKYDIVVEDGKSCGFTFQMDMAGCNPVDNLVFTLPELVSPPGTQICVPITVENYNNIVSNSFSFQWDPTVLQYTGVHNYPANTDSSSAFRNENLVGQGLLGVVVNIPSGAPIVIPASGELFEICFQVVGQLGDCTQLSITNLPTQIGIENQQGTQQAITADTGQVCVNFTPLMGMAEFIDSTCVGTATLKVTASGGQAPYEVRWEPISGSPVTSGSIATSGGTYTASGVPNGTFIVHIIDDNGFGQEILDTVMLNLGILGASLDLTKSEYFALSAYMPELITASATVAAC
ncbi:MAG: cohesin domain-containing protein [Saprospiraceae bacterium]